MKEFLIGLGIGVLIALGILIWQSIKRSTGEKHYKEEISKLKGMLADRMEIESEGVKKLKAENEELRKANENLRITNANLMQKPGRAEVSRLHIYQLAVDRLVINSPGFGAAWQSALKESEDEFSKTLTGSAPYWKRIIPPKTNAKLIENNAEVVEDQQ